MLPEEYSIEGKTVIVPGAFRGIAKASHAVLAESGDKVMVTALTSRYFTPLSSEMAVAGHPIETLTADATQAGLLALYLVSDASAYMTGETIYLDGGLSQSQATARLARTPIDLSEESSTD